MSKFRHPYADISIPLCRFFAIGVLENRHRGTQRPRREFLDSLTLLSSIRFLRSKSHNHLHAKRNQPRSQPALCRRSSVSPILARLLRAKDPRGLPSGRILAAAGPLAPPTPVLRSPVSRPSFAQRGKHLFPPLWRKSPSARAGPAKDARRGTSLRART